MKSFNHILKVIVLVITIMLFVNSNASAQRGLGQYYDPNSPAGGSFSEEDIKAFKNFTGNVFQVVGILKTAQGGFKIGYGKFSSDIFKKHLIKAGVKNVIGGFISTFIGLLINPDPVFAAMLPPEFDSKYYLADFDFESDHYSLGYKDRLSAIYNQIYSHNCKDIESSYGSLKTDSYMHFDYFIINLMIISILEYKCGFDKSESLKALEAEFNLLEQLAFIEKLKEAADATFLLMEALDDDNISSAVVIAPEAFAYIPVKFEY